MRLFLQEDTTVRSRILILLLLIVLSASGPLALANRAAAQEAAATPAGASQSLQWEPCDDVPDAECARLEVPIDPAQPDGDQLSLRLGRLPALDASHSQGSLLLIP